MAYYIAVRFCYAPNNVLRDVPSLQSMCIEAIQGQRQFKSIDQAAAIAWILPDIETNPLCRQLWRRIQLFLLDRAAFVLDRYDHSQLKYYFGDNMLNALIAANLESEAAKRRMSAYRDGTVLPVKATGTALEKSSSTATANTTSTPIQFPVSSSTGPYYPLESLLQGVQWPAGVDPARRESYLSPVDFEATMGMTREQFSALKPFRQQRIKKEKGLF
jgi:Villin headpiece domain